MRSARDAKTGYASIEVNYDCSLFISLYVCVCVCIGETAHDNLRGIKVRGYEDKESEDLSLRI